MDSQTPVRIDTADFRKHCFLIHASIPPGDFVPRALTLATVELSSQVPKDREANWPL